MVPSSASVDNINTESILPSSLKRKRESFKDHNTPITPSYSDKVPESPINQMPDLILFTQSGSILPLDDFLTDTRQRPKANPSSTDQDEDTYLQIAQVLADQVAQMSYQSFNNILACPPISDPSLHDSYAPKDLLTTMLQHSFPGTRQCILEELLDEYENISSIDAEERLFKIETPLAKIRRMEAPFDIAVSALPFWEELALAPTSAEKNVVAYCLCPDSTHIKECALRFLEMVKAAYQSCKLGKHRLGSNLIGQEDALVPLPSFTPDSSNNSRILEVYQNLGKSGITFR